MSPSLEGDTILLLDAAITQAEEGRNFLPPQPSSKEGLEVTSTALSSRTFKDPEALCRVLPRGGESRDSWMHPVRLGQRVGWRWHSRDALPSFLRALRPASSLPPTAKGKTQQAAH